MSALSRSEAWAVAGRRWCKFSLVGTIGMGVQLGVLAALTAAGVQYLLATALAVEAAVLHNFAWHQNFTWSDREGALLDRLARFHLANGVISLLGNLLLMRLLVGYFELPAVPANLLSISLCWVMNFLAADRVVFLASKGELRTPSPQPLKPHPQCKPDWACLKACRDANLAGMVSAPRTRTIS